MEEHINAVESGSGSDVAQPLVPKQVRHGLQPRGDVHLITIPPPSVANALRRLSGT